MVKEPLWGTDQLCSWSPIEFDDHVIDFKIWPFPWRHGSHDHRRGNHHEMMTLQDSSQCSMIWNQDTFQPFLEISGESKRFIIASSITPLKNIVCKRMFQQMSRAHMCCKLHRRILLDAKCFITRLALEITHSLQFSLLHSTEFRR